MADLVVWSWRQKLMMAESALIFKICTSAEWAQAMAAGTFFGSPVDFQDGFIHFSAAHQVSETAARHFADQTDLLLIAVDPIALGSGLRWEKSRGGDLFPHLYGSLPTSAAVYAGSLQKDKDGHVVLPK